MFKLNSGLLKKAKSTLLPYKNIYWIIGGSCAGKSTISKMIAKQIKAYLYDMDECIFGKYIPLYTKKRHPASKAWFSAKNSLDWVLSLSWKDFDRLNKAANAEYLDLFSSNIRKYSPNDLIFIDGGISYPSILSKVFPSKNIVCLYIPPAQSNRMWNTADERKPMKEMILALPQGEKKWKKFLFCDKKIAEISLKESREENIKVLYRTNTTSIDQLAGNILDYFGLS